MSTEEKKCISSGSTEQSENQIHSNVAGKFRAYRLSAESINAQLKEAKAVIEELKNEINFSRDTEKNLRNQIFSFQSRLLGLQQNALKFINLSDQQTKNEKVSQRIQERLQELEENINQLRQKSQNLFQCLTRELDLLKKIKDLEFALEAKNNECDLMKMEILTLSKEKENFETEFQKKCKNLENSLDNLQKKENETQVHCRETLLYYKQQIDDYERKIERYEKERKSFFEDFELQKPSETSPDKFTWPDSTVSLNAEKRSPKTPNSKRESENPLRSDKPGTQIFQILPHSKKPKLLNFKRSQNFSSVSKKQKPQLEFLTQDSSLTKNSEKTGRKRRLFSTNLNHYIE